MSVFINQLRQHCIDKDDRAEEVKAGDNYPHPVRTITYELADGTEGTAPVIAESDQEAVATFHELAKRDHLIGNTGYEVTDISPTDAEIAAIKKESSRLYRQLYQMRDRRSVGEIEEIIADQLRFSDFPPKSDS